MQQQPFANRIFYAPHKLSPALSPLHHCAPRAGGVALHDPGGVGFSNFRRLSPPVTALRLATGQLSACMVQSSHRPATWSTLKLFTCAHARRSLSSLSLRTCPTPSPDEAFPGFRAVLSDAAINRLRAYKPPPFPLWDRLPVRMRAAVLILLYADRFGDLRVVITMRAASLRSFSGHAALPGGKADDINETPYQIARREAWEEIGLPMEDRKIPKPFRMEKLCYLPPFLARTHVVVTPCVAYLHADAPAPGEAAPVVEHTLRPTLNASEVAAVFTAPFYNFLKSADLPPQPGHVLPPGHWYDGAWINWKDVAWRVHNFYVPVNNQQVSRPIQGSETVEETKQDIDFEGRFKVWGMTGRVMVDAARIAYGEPPEVEHNPGLGDTDIIMVAEQDGSFKEAAGKGPSRM
ncbi:hypothetical protein NLG97_g7054 [Lecanicillium saksenae]|uniref:Uncharacterized protein n=1 Tax=Lecanicillium saksenae TaxID=468837 RepID=A0ACC1QMX2_9HYPO|nr:hypothetical protein NLG97_g7054 [Lecanicillium saksenae]